MTLPPPTTHHPHQLVLTTERVVDDEDDDWCYVDFGDILQDPPKPPPASHSDSRPTSPTQHDASDEDLVLPIASHSDSRPTSPTQHDASDEDLVLPIASHSDSRPTSPTQHDASDEDLVLPIASHSDSRPTSPTQHDASDEDLVLPIASHSDSRPTSPTQHDASDEDLVLPIASHSDSRPTSPTQHDASDEDLVLPIASHSDSRPTSPTQHDASDEDLVFCNEYFEDVVVGLRKTTDQQQKQTPLIEILVTEVDLSGEQTCKPESRFLNSMEGVPCDYNFDVYDEMEDEDDSLLPSDFHGSKYCFLNHDVVGLVAEWTACRIRNSVARVQFPDQAETYGQSFFHPECPCYLAVNRYLGVRQLSRSCFLGLLGEEERLLGQQTAPQTVADCSTLLRVDSREQTHFIDRPTTDL
ncbi:uncharacterized protein [Procambarus clarkii]|uniref:uncharacterized protein isoform X3 n=1 Tax=Procambarus clarkii TaxID=6728 RepID=UPI00374352F0